MGTVTLRLDGVAIRGESSGEMMLPFARLAKLRAGIVEGRPAVQPVLCIWLRDAPKPFLLMGLGAERHAYGTFLRALAARLLSEAPGLPVETGGDLFVPVVAVGSFSLLALASAGFSIHLALVGDDWTIPLGALVVSLVLLGLLTPWVVTRYVPRRVTRVEEIERVLPGCYDAAHRRPLGWRAGGERQPHSTRIANTAQARPASSFACCSAGTSSRG